MFNLLIFSVGLLDIKDIVWPGMALKPPEGLPEKRFVRVSFLEEDPYVMLSPPSACRVGSGGNKGVLCQMVPDDALRGVNVTQERLSDDTEFFRWELQIDAYTLLLIAYVAKKLCIFPSLQYFLLLGKSKGRSNFLSDP